MKFYSRFTLGIIIGSFNILVYFALTIYASTEINGTAEKHQRLDEAKTSSNNAFFIVLLIIYLIMMSVSGLLILAIVKRRHNLMLPWLILNAIGFVLHWLRLMYHICAGISHGVALLSVVRVLIMGLLISGLSALMLWLIISLFRIIRQENMEKTCHIQYLSADEFSIESFE